MLPDGSRLHVVIPNITRRHMAVNIRKFAIGLRVAGRSWSRAGSLTEQAARFLEASVAAGLNVLVAGGTQAGKTTMLNALCGGDPGRERVVTVEEVFELSLRCPTSWRCRRGRPTSRAPARSRCAAWSRKRCGCARRA